jgi:hypothetical protein
VAAASATVDRGSLLDTICFRCWEYAYIAACGGRRPPAPLSPKAGSPETKREGPLTLLRGSTRCSSPPSVNKRPALRLVEGWAANIDSTAIDRGGRITA